MKTIADLLAEHQFFAGLPAASMELISGCGTNVHFEAGAAVFNEGDPADTFYVLRRGSVAIEIGAPHRDPVVIETIGAGEVLGVSWLMPPYRWSFDGRARGEVNAVQLDAACLRGKCDDDPVLGYALYKRFAGLMRDRLHATQLQLLDLYGSHVG
jgi:CRP-like cAMP-binding protein